MIIDAPAPAQAGQLRVLWKEAFGDSDSFLDSFFSVGFSFDRCRCLCLGGKVAAALYWFDCVWQERPLAYLYAVATGKEFQGQGFCRRLMEDTHRHLSARGYTGTVLVPGSAELFSLYKKLGYRSFGGIREFTCNAAARPVPLRPVNAGEYAALRRRFLDTGGVVQEGAVLDFLATQAEFYAGADFLLAGTVTDGVLTAQELLGSTSQAASIVTSLGAKQGVFRVPGTQPFAMYHPLSAAPGTLPDYFGIALD